MKQRQYDLCIDDDKQVTQLASRRWPSIQVGTTIVMRVVFQQKTRLGVEYTCHFCGAVNHISRPKNLLQRQAGCSIDWWVNLYFVCWWHLTAESRVCKRRFQISQQGCATQHSIDSVPKTEEMGLIRNFHVRKTVCYCGTLLAVLNWKLNNSTPYPTLMVLWTRSTLSGSVDYAAYQRPMLSRIPLSDSAWPCLSPAHPTLNSV